MRYQPKARPRFSRPISRRILTIAIVAGIVAGAVPTANGQDVLRGRTDWAAAIDSTWGASPWTISKFDTYWNRVSSSFACFQGLSVDWDSLYTLYANEINAGVSKGRYVAILNHLSRALHESHTFVFNNAVNFNTPLAPGVPLLVGGGAWGPNDHFGAGLTPLPDGSLLVYDAVSAHPLGMAPGDIVLGYDGAPWSQLVQQLLDAQLPIRPTLTGYWDPSASKTWWGGSDPAYEHGWLMTAGMNWHLFDTIDIVKHDTGDTVHLPTSLLAGQSMDIYCTEQLPIPGVPLPDYDADQVVSYGIIENTNVGYIYVVAWSGDVETAFHDAVASLMDTAGLIIDLRTNFGGNLFLSNPGLSLLFDETVPTIGFLIRCNQNDRLALCPGPYPPSLYDIPGDPASYYDGPIAVLVGPGTMSSGDFVAHRMTFHPEARVFGKPTSAAFNQPMEVSMGASFTAWYAHADTYALSNPDTCLTRSVFPVDVEVWLDRDDVAQGIDTVVEAALDWMRTIVTDVPQAAHGTQVSLRGTPSPFRTSTTIHYTVPSRGAVDVGVFDVLGRRVASLVGDVKTAGTHSVTWDARDQTGSTVAPGVYFVRLTSGSGTATGKVVRTD